MTGITTAPAGNTLGGTSPWSSAERGSQRSPGSTAPSASFRDGAGPHFVVGVALVRARRSRRHCLHPGAREFARADARRHQAVSVLRSRRVAEPRLLDVRGRAVRRMGAPPADRLPLADRTVVLAARHHRLPRLGRPPPLDRNGDVRSRRRRALGCPHPRARFGCCTRRGTRLPVVAVHPGVHLADITPAAPVGSARVDRRIDDPSRCCERIAAGRLRLAGSAREMARPRCGSRSSSPRSAP